MIGNDVRFIGYLNFYENKERIKEKYANFDTKEKWIYKWYVYSRRQLKEYTCDLIWNFLNDNYEEGLLCTTDDLLQNECHKYRM